MIEQLKKDSAFYWSVCILKKLHDMELITTEEYRKIRDMSADYYNTEVIAA